MQADGGPADPASFVPPVAPSSSAPPDPPAPGPDLTPRVVALELKVASLQQQVNTLQVDVAVLTARVNALPPPSSLDPAALLLAIDAALLRYEVNGRSASTFAHAHAVRLPLVRKA